MVDREDVVHFQLLASSDPADDDRTYELGQVEVTIGELIDNNEIWLSLYSDNLPDK